MHHLHIFNYFPYQAEWQHLHQHEGYPTNVCIHLVCSPKAASSVIYIQHTNPYPIAQAIASRHCYSLYGKKIPSAISLSHNIIVFITVIAHVHKSNHMLHHMNIHNDVGIVCHNYTCTCTYTNLTQ